MNLFKSRALMATLSVFAAIGSSYAAESVTRNSPMGWTVFDDNLNGGRVDFAQGPGDNGTVPPLGSGSLRFRLSASNQGYAIGKAGWSGVKLSELTSLGYSTYVQAAPGPQAVALQFNIDYDVTDSNTTWQGRLVFEPYQTGSPVVKNVWQNWDALAGKWWATRAPGNTVAPQSSPKTISEILAVYPNAGISTTQGGMIFKAGSGWTSFDGRVDAFTIGVNNVDTTYDFEYGCTFFQDPFNFNPVLEDFQRPDAWYPDRYRPAGFVAENGALKISISAADGLANRPPGYQSRFYNTQGRKFDLGNGKYTSIKGKLYVGADWQTNLRRSDIWAGTEDADGYISGYPILGISNEDRNNLKLRAFVQDTDFNPGNGYVGGWVDLTSQIDSVSVDTWYELEIRLMPDRYLFIVDGEVVLEDPITFGSVRFREMMLQGYNFNDGGLTVPALGESYDIYWDDVAAVGPTIELDPYVALFGETVTATLLDSGGNPVLGENLAVSGEGYSNTITSGSGLSFALPGIYSFAWDGACGVTALATVVSNNQGHVTGGGKIYSPAGSLATNLSAEGTASFGFSSKYGRGATVPTGSTRFEFVAGSFVFESVSYDWLVVSGPQAQFKGVGTVNGSGDYGFMVTARDSSPDTFRLKVWDRATGDVVYDNGANSPLTGGQIKIHR